MYLTIWGLNPLKNTAIRNTTVFDDLGLEPSGRYYGKDLNVVGEVLLSRYHPYLTAKRNLKTYATTNLNAGELEALYSNRLRSRMRELFNLVAFDRESKDKRK
ncbi:hypothetical protein DSM04_105109 [Leeuwenhoekiella aestuarii]|uniref:IstB-like ATP binding protein n=1 Tax=Leeuwenhoekiella aestuarii TaxID=2249426 RepID=A0A4V1KP08_9FLAO|nr:hypothetical protein DSM04_105109 [Leeuwenhoekiella aestuarii]